MHNVFQLLDIYLWNVSWEMMPVSVTKPDSVDSKTGRHLSVILHVQGYWRSSGGQSNESEVSTILLLAKCLNSLKVAILKGR